MDSLRDNWNDSDRKNPWLGKDVGDAGRGAARFDQQAVRADRTIAIGVISSRVLGEHASRRADQRLSRKDFLEGACQQEASSLGRRARGEEAVDQARIALPSICKGQPSAVGPNGHGRLIAGS